jgi:acyl dehydratase
MVSPRHILSQGPVLQAIGATAARGLAQRFGFGSKTAPSTPGVEIHDTVPPRAGDLIADYVRHVGGDPEAYRDSVPAHFFPQWMFAYGGRVLADLPYPLLAVVNAGCRIDTNAVLPQGQPLVIRARLDSLKADERKALISQRMITGTERQPEAVVAHLFAYVPLSKGKGSGKPSGGKSVVPEGARELERWNLSSTAGLEFAMLTGDFNPLHWVKPYARMLGFKERILHGFSTLARTMESLYRLLYDGRTDALASIEVRFTRPLVLPANVGVYVLEHRVFVGDSVGGPAYLEGSFTPRE